MVGFSKKNNVHINAKNRIGDKQRFPSRDECYLRFEFSRNI